MYQPNFNDPRVRSRIKTALGFSLGVLSTTKPHQWSTRYIDKFFGTQNHNLSKYLRKTLLITTNEKYYFGTESKCKEYILNKSGVEYLKERLNLCERDENVNAKKHTHILPYCSTSPKTDYELVKQAFSQKFNKELTELDFAYDDKSNRYWHPIQNIRSNYRTQLLNDYGLKHQYDIECCAPTLILAHSRNCGNDQYLSALQSYLKNRTGIRKMISRDAEIPLDTAKRIINALFAGAVISHSHTTEIYKMLAGDHARIEFLKQHHYLIALKKDIKTCWDYINETLPQRYKKTKKGHQRRVPLSSKRKWGVYFELERRVIDVVKQYLIETNNKCFLIHDGWTCMNELDISEVEKYITEKTGMKVKLEEER